MATKIFTKEKLAERDALHEKWKSSAATLKQAVDDYNATLQEVREFRTGVAEAVDGFIDEHGDKWKEGDVGQAWDGLKTEWEDFEPGEDVELEEDNPDTLTDLNTDPS